MKRRRSSSAPSALRRWLRFNFVGLIGVGIQLAALQTLLLTCELDYRVATLLAVEVTVLHNFVWHWHYTWRERRVRQVKIVLRRLLAFHLTNGAVSLAGSWTLVALLVGRAGVPVIAANMVSILACSLVNFLLAEVLVFGEQQGRGRRSRYLQLLHTDRANGARCNSFSLQSTGGDR